MDNNYEEIELRELIQIIYKGRRLLAGLVLAAIAASIAVSLMMTPVYETSTTIALGRFDNETYNKSEFAKNIILAKENLMGNKELADIINQYGAKTVRQKLQKFKDSVSITTEQDTNIIRITVNHTDPKTAVKIADLLVNDFKKKSDEMYEKKASIPREAIKEAQKELEYTEGEIAKIKKWIAEVDEKSGGTVEEDLVLTRLRENLSRYDESKVSLQDKIDTLNNQLLSYEPASVLEIATEPISPVKPNKKLIVAISAVMAFMFGIFLIFIMEYFNNNPIELKSR